MKVLSFLSQSLSKGCGRESPPSACSTGARRGFDLLEPQQPGEVRVSAPILQIKLRDPQGGECQSWIQTLPDKPGLWDSKARSVPFPEGL